METITPTATDIAWLAGLLEGEGCFGRYETAGKPRFCVVCVSTDRDVLESVQRITGCGTIKHRVTQSQLPNHKAAYHWQTWSRLEVLHVARLVLPYMHSRRKRKVEGILHELGDFAQTRLVL